MPNGIADAQEVFPAYTYSRPLPQGIISVDREFAGEIEQFYKHINNDHCSGPATLLVEMVMACVCRNVIYLLTQVGVSIVYETHRPNDRGYTALVANEALSSAERMLSQNSEYLYVGSVGSFNYGHWLIDDLPRLAAFFPLRARCPEALIVIVVPSYSDAINRARVDSIGAFLHDQTKYAIHVIDPDGVLFFERLHYCTPVSYHPVSKGPAALSRAVQRLTSGAPAWTSEIGPAAETSDVRQKSGATVNAAGRIFVDRRRQRGRVLINTDALRFRLEMEGFISVDPEGMSFNEQRACFAQARVVVGCMGAAMTNTLFCPPGARLLYLAPEGWTEPFYWDLAAVCGHQYSVIYGQVVEAGTHAHLSSFNVPWNMLKSALSSLVA